MCTKNLATRVCITDCTEDSSPVVSLYMPSASLCTVHPPFYKTVGTTIRVIVTIFIASVCFLCSTDFSDPGRIQFVIVCKLTFSFVALGVVVITKASVFIFMDIPRRKVKSHIQVVLCTSIGNLFQDIALTTLVVGACDIIVCIITCPQTESIVMFCCKHQSAESSFFYCFYQFFRIKIVGKCEDFCRTLCSVIFAPFNVVKSIRSKVTECCKSLFHVPELFIIWCCSPGFWCLCIFWICCCLNIYCNNTDCCFASVFCCNCNIRNSICNCCYFSCFCINRCHFCIT